MGVRFIFLMALLISWLLPCQLWAAQSYRISVETLAKDRTTTEQDIEKAFSKLIGQLTQKTTKPIAISKIAPLIEQYQYKNKGDKEFLSITFNKARTLQFLDSLKLTPVDTPNQVLLYVIMQGNKQIENINGNKATKRLVSHLSAQAKKMNIELITPVGDLEDLQVLDSLEKRQAKSNSIESLTQRYDAQGLLLITMQTEPSSEQQTLSWTLYTNNQLLSSAEDTVAPAQSLNTALEGFQSGKITQAIPHHVIVQINHAHGNSDYEAMMNMLKKMPGVNNVQLDGVTPDSVLFKLSVSIANRALINELSSHKQLSLEQYHSNGLIELQINS